MSQRIEDLLSLAGVSRQPMLHSVATLSVLGEEIAADLRANAAERDLSAVEGRPSVAHRPRQPARQRAEAQR